MPTQEHDVAIVGASLAGCAAATHLARHGLKVALIERSTDLAAYKTTCTHYIQPSGVPAMRRLGVDALIEEAGGIRNSLKLWTRYGWSQPPDEEVPHGYNIRRERLDPMVRALAVGTPGVELLGGHRALGVVRHGGRITGVRTAGRDGGEREIGARLVVAADGRDSHMAKRARVPGLRLPNRRFAYWAYFRDLPLKTGSTAQLWFLDPRVAYAFPEDEGLTLVAFWGMKKELADFKADVDAAVRARFAELPDAPDLEAGERVSPWLGKLDMPNVSRRPVHRGMALIGDAAEANDPLWGVGCGWAFQSAEWLADAVGPALQAGGDLGGALRSYARRHRRETLLHHVMMCDYSTGRRFLPPEKLMFAAASRDPRTSGHVHRFAGRIMPVHSFVSPRAIARAGLAVARGAWR
jgi:menaquinone-9 beta-reductase